MQETRQHILDILKERKQATVDEIVDELRRRRGSITAVTVRHHLTRLQQEELITMPELLHRTTPGRPQHVYTLTDKAKAHFPNNYQRLLSGLLEQMRCQLPAQGVNVILEGVADQMAREACIPADLSLPQRLDIAVAFLNEHGYNAFWEKDKDSYILHTSNCPYHHVAPDHQMLCEMDMRLVASLLKVVPRRMSHVPAGDATCSYMIPNKQE